MGFLPWKIRVSFPGESQLRHSRATQATVHAGCFSVSIIHRTLTWTTGSLTCTQMLMHAIAHGVTDTYKSLHWKLTLGEKSLAAPGNRTWISGVTVWCSNQLSYIPNIAQKTSKQKTHFFHMWLSLKSINESDVNKWIQETVKSWEKWIKPQSTCGSLAPRINEHDWGHFNFNAFLNGWLYQRFEKDEGVC